ncbi:MAG: nuclear transport factor 2 family protein [Anaerolineales bacterium]|nr:nuclear transport factor 2 family protein [Anaerolineales bacterium]
MNVLNTRKGVGKPTTTDEVRAIFSDYSAALLCGDADKWIGVWADDGIQLHPGEQPSIGHDELLAEFVEFVESMEVKRFDMVVDEVIDAGSLVIARSHFNGNAISRDDDAETVVLHGHQLTVFKRATDGSLVMFRDCYTMFSDSDQAE